VYEYVTQLHNTKAGESIDITVVELLPRSEDESIKVHVISPPQSSLATATQPSTGSASVGTSLSGEGQLKPGSVMKNKITNNVVFSKTLAAQEKMEISFSYSVEWPHEKEVEIS
jgi:hypothetical protein